MPQDWKDLPEDDLLNFEGTNTALMARYERIMQKRSTDAVLGLSEKLAGLMETMYRASQGLQEKADKLHQLFDKNSSAQSRQQTILIALSIVVAASTAAYTWITWESVAAMREANEIQRQVLALQKSSVGAVTPNE